MLFEMKTYLAECNDCGYSVEIKSKGKVCVPSFWQYAIALPNDANFRKNKRIVTTILLCPTCKNKDKLSNWDIINREDPSP